MLWLAAAPLASERFDATFQTLAPRAGVDWRVLKAIAWKESGLDPLYVNPSGYVGLFQTKPANCRRALRGEVLAGACDALMDPYVSTAVGAAMARHAAGEIERACPKAGVRTAVLLIYVNHNLGPEALAFMLRDGCSEEALRAAAIRYYRGPGARVAHAYAAKYARDCLAGADEATCTALPKLDYAALVAADALAMGVQEWRFIAKSLPEQ
ncbi:MAG: transglycosylase SLT domain-containing protein [Myxococcaceae bacterium]